MGQKRDSQLTDMIQFSFFLCMIYKQFVQIKTSPIIDGCKQMFTFTCFPETSLFNVPVIRLFQLSANLTKTLKQPLNQRVVWKQT